MKHVGTKGWHYAGSQRLGPDSFMKGESEGCRNISVSESSRMSWGVRKLDEGARDMWAIYRNALQAAAQ